MWLFPAPAVARPVVAFLTLVALLGYGSAASAQTYNFFTLAGTPSSGSADGVGTAPSSAIPTRF